MAYSISRKPVRSPIHTRMRKRLTLYTLSHRKAITALRILRVINNTFTVQVLHKLCVIILKKGTCTLCKRLTCYILSAQEWHLSPEHVYMYLNKTVISVECT